MILRTQVNWGKEFNLIAIGPSFIANPDLIQKFKTKKELKEYEPAILEALI